MRMVYLIDSCDSLLRKCFKQTLFNVTFATVVKYSSQNSKFMKVVYLIIKRSW